MDTSKIIKGVVSDRNFTTTAPIIKENYGIYLQIEGVELPETYQVDFSNEEHHGTSVTMIGNADGVRIPRQFIDTGKDIFAFLYHVGEDFGRTVYKFRIPNKLRPDRTDEEPTPEEQSTIDQLIGALNTAVEQTAQDVVDAEASAQAAGYDADRAEEARSASLNYAEHAEASAISAEQSATASANSASASAQSASQSAQIKTDVQALVATAQQAVTDASHEADLADTSARSASASANSASASAQSASGYASSAQTSATTASAKAQEASQSATTATQKATESAQSASQALTYKTDAESAKTASQTAQGLAESARDTAVSAKTDAESARDDAESARDEAQQAVASISGALDEKAPVITDTASGAIASFSDGADDLPLKSLVVDINPVQDLSHGDPSPENLCPISGWTQVDVKQRGKNLIEGYFPLTLSLLNNVVYLGGINGNTEGTTIYFPCKKGVTYVRSHLPNDSSNRSYWGAFDHFPEPKDSTADIQNAGLTFTPSVDGYCCIYLKNAADAELINFWQVEVGTTATEYEAPKTNLHIPISWQTEAGTVYGGKLDVLTGKLVVDRAMVDLGTLSWYVPHDPVGMTAYNTDISVLPSALYSNPHAETDILCEKYKTCKYNDITAGREIGVAMFGSGDARYIRIFAPEYANKTATEIKADLSGVKLIYTLLTPIEIQLSPNHINSLLGVNNIWADSGDTEAVYRADTKTWVQRKIAEAVAAALNS